MVPASWTHSKKAGSLPSNRLGSFKASIIYRRPEVGSGMFFPVNLQANRWFGYSNLPISGSDEKSSMFKRSKDLKKGLRSTSGINYKATMYFQQ